MSSLFTLLLPVSVYLCLSLTFAWGQTKYTGRLKTPEGHSLPYASVLLLNAVDSFLVKGDISKDDGFFELESPTDTPLVLRVSNLGYQDLYISLPPVPPLPSVIDLGVLTLYSTDIQLQAVEVAARRPFLEQKTDRLVVNVSNSITYAGGTALEVLQRLPGVRVNRQTQTLALSGKQGVAVMINGKLCRIPEEALLQMLDGITAASIERIEIIHTPPANFEAEGNAGIIHIVLKNQAAQGINGGTTWQGGYGKRGKWGTSNHFNYRKDQINLYGKYDFNHNINPQTFENYRRILHSDGVVEEADLYSFRPQLRTNVHNARLGLDWQPDKRTTLGLLATFFDRNRFNQAFNGSTYLEDGLLYERIDMPNSETNHFRSFTGNFNLVRQLSKGHTLSLDADHVAFDITRPSQYHIKRTDANNKLIETYQTRIDMRTPIRVATGKIDYEGAWGKHLKLEAGAKLSVMGFDNTTAVEFKDDNGMNWSTDPEFNSNARFHEAIAGMYLSAGSASLLPKTDIKAGIRWEATATHLSEAMRGELVNRRYASFFPSLFISRTLGQRQSLNFSYSRRIRRPQFSWLAPWLNFVDPTTLQRGNPALQPAFTDAWRAAWSYKGLQLSLVYSLERQALRPISLVDTLTGLQSNTYANLDRFRSLGIELGLNLSPVKWWEVQFNGSLLQQQTRSILEGIRFELGNLAYTLNSTHTFSLPGKWKIEVSGDFDSPRYYSISRWRANGSLNVGMMKDLGHKWGKLRLSATDILQSTNWYGLTEQADANLYVRTAFRTAERTFMLVWSKDFGNKNIKGARKRQTGAAEEAQRL